MWIIRSSEADGTLTFLLASGACRTVGRAPRADFVVDAALVSRLHCRIVDAGERIEVEDLSSTNGTFINDQRVDRGQLRSGDRLRIGRVELTVERTPAAPGACSA
jgi:pSer/pThr/pTyr-binding forkhead associated (FHA) protein